MSNISTISRSTSAQEQAGFAGVLEVLAVVVIIGILGLVGWRLYHLHNTKPANSHTSSSIDTSVKPHSTTIASGANPYAGWESYCSTIGGICLKYPSTWVKAAQSGLVTFTSPSKTVAVQYNPSLVGVGGYCPLTACTFDEEAVTPTSTANSVGLEVIKGVYANSASNPSSSSSPTVYVPMYFVTSQRLMAPFNLKIGQYVDVGYFGNFLTSPADSSSIEQLQVVQVPNSGSGFGTASNANTWLAQSDVTTAGQILSSVTVDSNGH